MSEPKKEYEVFTQSWVQAWADELRSSEAYRLAAIKWEGALMVEMEADPDYGIDAERAVFLDLWHGDCRSGRLPIDGDQDNAEFIIRGPAAAWKRVLDGDLEPIFGIMSGKLKLTRGSMTALMPFVGAAKELVAAAVRTGGYFPNSNSNEGENS